MARTNPPMVIVPRHDPVCGEQHHRGEPDRDDRGLSDVEHRERDLVHHRGALVPVQRLVEPTRLVRFVAEVLDGLEVEQTVDRLAARAPFLLVHPPAELDAPLRHHQGVADVEDDRRHRGQRDDRVQHVPQNDEHEHELDRGRNDREQTEAQQERDRPRSAADRLRQPSGLPPEVKPQRQRMEMVEHIQRDGANRPLRDIDEDGVACLVERKGQDPRGAVGQDERHRYRDEADVVEGERIDRTRIEQGDVHRGYPGRDQHGHREHDSNPQRRRAGRPQIGQQGSQGPPPAGRAFLGNGESRKISHRSCAQSPRAVSLPCQGGIGRANLCIMSTKTRDGSPGTAGCRQDMQAGTDFP